VSALMWPSAPRMSQSARDQIWPSGGPHRPGRPGSGDSCRGAAGSAETSRCTTSSPSRRCRPGQAPRDDVGDVAGPVVAEPLADRPRLLAREREVLREVDRMAVLVEDHLGVLGIVHPALAEPELILRMVGGERVVVAELVDPNPLGLHVHGRVLAGAEPKALDVALRLGDPVVRHHLLEAVVVPVLLEGVGCRPGRVAGLAHDLGPTAD